MILLLKKYVICSKFAQKTFSTILKVIQERSYVILHNIDINLYLSVV